MSVLSHRTRKMHNY